MSRRVRVAAFVATLLLAGVGLALVRRAPSAARLQERALLSCCGRANAQVSRVQLILAYSGFDPGEIDGLLGPRTRAALRSFQAARGLPQSGRLGFATWARLMKADTLEGPFLVARVQRALFDAGFDPGALDGRMAAGTDAALAAFQRARGLAPSGRLDAATWTALRTVLTR